MLLFCFCPIYEILPLCTLSTKIHWFKGGKLLCQWHSHQYNKFIRLDPQYFRSHPNNFSHHFPIGAKLRSHGKHFHGCSAAVLVYSSLEFCECVCTHTLPCCDCLHSSNTHRPTHALEAANEFCFASAGLLRTPSPPIHMGAVESWSLCLNQGWAASVLEGHCLAEFISNPDKKTHLPAAFL